MENPIPPECQELIDSFLDFLEISQKLITGFPFHENGKAYEKMKENQAKFFNLAFKIVEERAKEISEEDQRLAQAGESGEEEGPIQVDFLTYLLHSGKMAVGEVATNVTDLMTAAIDPVRIMELYILT